MRKSIYEFDPSDAERFAHDQGIRASRRGDELRFTSCPYCRNKTDDKNTFAINLRTGQFKCLRATCGAKGNMLTLAKDFNFSLGRDADEYYSPRRRYRDLSSYPRPIVRSPAVEYMEGRGISKAVTEAYSITTQKDRDDVIVFPFFDEGGKLQFVKYRNAAFDKSKGGSKEWTQKDCKPILFGMDHCDPEKSGVLILTEGQIDSLSVAECGIPNAASVPTGAQGFTWVPYCWDFLGRFNTLIVFGDHEKGKITLLDEMKVRFVGSVKHVRVEDYQDCKDANELLQKHGKQAVIDAVARAVPVEDELIKNAADIVRKSQDEIETIDTGFLTLDRILDGFRMGYLILLTGERGYGKSTLASQFIVKALEQNKNCFCYSGELDETQFQEWIDRQAAGDAFTNPIINRRGKKNYIVHGDAEVLIHHWYDGRLFVYDNKVIRKEERILETVQKAITQYGARVVLLDNLMTAMIDEDPREDANSKQTAFVAELAEMAHRFGTLIFLIAHPRKLMGGKGFTNDDILGSSNIANLSDVILRYTKPNEDDERRADRILQVTKNRNDGEIYMHGIPLWYEASSKRITDTKGKFDWSSGWEKALEDEDGFLAIPDDMMEEDPF